MINVVGAGPAGSYFSYLDKDCTIFEEHKEIGKPAACTGIMTKAIFDLIEIDKEVIVNELKRVRVLGMNNEVVFNYIQMAQGQLHNINSMVPFVESIKKYREEARSESEADRGTKKFIFKTNFLALLNCLCHGVDRDSLAARLSRTIP